jgi:hypothetical protein
MNQRFVKRAALGVSLSLLLVILGATSMAALTHFQPTQASESTSTDAIVGAWLLDAHGAPFVPHVAIFHADGTFLIDNPEAGDPHTSDSLGAGAWKRDPQHANTIIGQFQEINADRASAHYASRLVVTFTLTMTRADTFSGPAEATYYAPDGVKQNAQPYPAMLTGQRILP